MERSASPNAKPRKCIAMDVGTGRSCMVLFEIIDGVVSSATPFSGYKWNPATRKGETREVPTMCGHIRGNTDKDKALYGFGVGAATDTDKAGVEVVYNLKAGLYSKNDGQRQRLSELALDVPYLSDFYKGTPLQRNPETWLLADFIHYLVKLVDSPEAEWICSIPSNYTQTSKMLYIEMLGLAGLEGRVELSAEVAAAFEWFAREPQPLKEFPNCLPEDGEIAVGFDFGAGTADFGCFRNNQGTYEELMPSDAVSIGPSNIIDLAVDYISKKCGMDKDSDIFKGKMIDYRRQFTERMHGFDPSTDVTKTDHHFDIGETRIEVKSGQMTEWFEIYTDCIGKFLAKKIHEYSAVYNIAQKPSIFFLFGGGSQAQPVVNLLQQMMGEPLFAHHLSKPACKLVQAGFDSSTTVALGLAHLHANPCKQQRRSYYWFGILRLERYHSTIHANAQETDIVTEKGDKLVKCVQWLIKPEDNWGINDEADRLDVKMVALLESRAALAVRKMTVDVCITKGAPGAVAKALINGRKWSYRSDCENCDFSKIEFNIEVDHSLLKTPLETYKDLPEVHFTIFAAATDTGADIYCKQTRPEADLRSIGKIIHGGLISIMPRVYEEGDGSENSEINAPDTQRETVDSWKPRGRKRRRIR